MCALTLVLVLAACQGVQLLTDQPLSIRFESWGDNMPTIGGPTATTSAGEVTVSGVFTTPTPCYQFEGSASLQARHLRMLIDARAVGEVCATVIGRRQYRLTALGLARGPYSVSVHHRRFEGRDGQDSTVAELSVNVP